MIITKLAWKNIIFSDVRRICAEVINNNAGKKSKQDHVIQNWATKRKNPGGLSIFIGPEEVKENNPRPIKICNSICPVTIGYSENIKRNT